MRAALLALVLWSGSALAANALAVLPFKNLNADPGIDWLKLGIAETMVADLKKAGHTMVERDQVDKALAELALQGQKLDEDSRAAKAGKLMGASTVVVGGYQKAGEQLRITARFVSVESGVVERTAKVTGKMTEVFELQDQIVAELAKLKPPPGAAKGRPQPVKRPAATQKTLDAYKSYSQALASSSQAERVEKLQEALDLDPSFSYAADDLKALRERLNVYGEKAAKAQDAQSKKLFAELNAPGLTAQERNTKAIMYLSSFLSSFRWATALEEAQRIYAMKFEPTMGMDPREQASMYIFMALKELKRRDLALQAGERHLKEFPAGNMRQSVEMSMRFLIDEIERQPRQRKEGKEELAKLDKEGPPRNAFQAKSREFQRCTVAARALLFEEADRDCTAFQDKYRGQPDEHDFHALSYFVHALSFYERGEFDKARALFATAKKEHPEWAAKQNLDSSMVAWPKP